MRKIYDKPDIEILLFDVIGSVDSDEPTIMVSAGALENGSTTPPDFGSTQSLNAGAPNFGVYTVEDVIVR